MENSKEKLDSRPRVLIIDNNNYEIAAIGIIFLNSGYRVDVTESVKESIEKIESIKGKHEPELIIIELDTPDMPPLEFIRQIRSIELTSKNIPVILIINEDQKKLLPPKTEISGYVVKPISAEKIADEVYKTDASLANLLYDSLEKDKKSKMQQ